MKCLSGNLLEFIDCTTMITKTDKANDSNEQSKASMLRRCYTPKSGLSPISHCSIKGLSVRDVMRIENMTTQVKFS